MLANLAQALINTVFPVFPTDISANLVSTASDEPQANSLEIRLMTDRTVLKLNS